MASDRLEAILFFVATGCFAVCWRLTPDKRVHGNILQNIWRNIFRRFAASTSCAPRGLFIDLLMPPDRAEEALVNILGRYEYWVEKHGPRKARIIFAAQSIGCVITFWADWAMKRLRLLTILRRS